MIQKISKNLFCNLNTKSYMNIAQKLKIKSYVLIQKIKITKIRKKYDDISF